MANTHTYSKQEEIVNALTHGLGACLSIVALVYLIVNSVKYGDVWHVVSFTLYGVTMLLLYVSSTLVHSFPEGKLKNLFEIFDHSSIYLFIAGTYTPLLFVVVRGPLGWSLFGVLWGLALSGVVFKSFFVKRFLFLSTLFYILMGWMAIFIWQPLATTLPSAGFELIILGGVLYTVGSVFYMWRGFKYHHAVWHLFVLGGSALHFFAIFDYVLPIK